MTEVEQQPLVVWGQRIAATVGATDGETPMQTMFPGFYRPTNDEFKAIWAKGLFILDSSVLLNIYRYPVQARDELLGTLTTLKDRIWIPHHVGLEFQRNRPTVMAEQKRRFREVREVVSGAIASLEGEFGKLQLRDRHSLIDPDVLVGKLKPVIAEYTKELDALEGKQTSVYEDDGLRVEIDKLFAGKVGKAPTKEEIDALSVEATARIAAKIPPGYRDEDKEKSKEPTFSYRGVVYEKKLGDLIVWKQIIDHLKVSKFKHAILVTDDDKDDWWWEVESKGSKRLGPRPELVAEITNSADLSQFYMYSSDQFLRFAKDYIKAKVSDESIDQVREIASTPPTGKPSRWDVSSITIHNAVVDWYSASVQPDSIVENDLMTPDYIAIKGDERIGIDIMADRIDSMPPSRILARATNVADEITDNSQVSRCEIVVVTRPHRVAILRKRLLALQSNFPESITWVLGTLVDGPDEAPQFEPAFRLNNKAISYV